MKIHTKQFPTEEEAKAFIEGVEYVNDSAIEVCGISNEHDGYVGFIVHIHDWGCEDEVEVCCQCGVGEDGIR